MAGLLVAGVAGFYGLGLHRDLTWDAVRAHVGDLREAVGRHWVGSLAAFFLVYVTVTALSVPVATVLTLAAGALFGRVAGTAVVSVASTLGASAAFLASRYVLRDWVERRYRNRLRTINREVEREGAFYLFTLRLTPLVPFFLINLGMGLTRVRLGTFMVVSWVGMLPATFLYVNAGRELGRIESPKSVLSPAVVLSLALLGLAPLTFRRLVRPGERGRWSTLVLAAAVVALAGLLGWAVSR